jgi:hypothetical protein
MDECRLTATEVTEQLDHFAAPHCTADTHTHMLSIGSAMGE